MPKIIAFICGGIGNQLFMYAAARRMALMNNAELVLDDVSGFARDQKYSRNYQLDHFNICGRKATARERLEPASRIRRKLARTWNKRLAFDKRWYLEQHGPDWEPRLLQYKPKKSVYLHGYWQSEDYFRDVEQTIRKDLRIIPPDDPLNLETAAKIRNSNAVAIHVRWFDKSHHTAAHNASMDYYRRAIDLMESSTELPFYFLFSDDPDAARSKVDLPESRVTFINHNNGDANAYADLWLMTQCRHFIIANSTFSWWGAWLANALNGVTIAPDIKINGVMAWGFKGLIPERWLLV